MLEKKVSMFTSCFLGFYLLLALSACQSSGGAVVENPTGAGRAGQPDWVRAPYTKYDERVNVAAVGNGSSRQAAERDALGKLVAIFGQSIQVDDTISTSYQQAVTSGVIANWSEKTSVDSTITTSAGMDTLIGAEIGDAWDNGREYYAVAVLNKAKAAMTYSEMVQANEAIINNLVGNISAAEKNTLDGLARYQFAAMLADVNASYGAVLSVIGSPFPGLKPGSDYRLEAQNITKAIPVGIRVKNDKAERIQGVFAKAFSDLGFRSGGTNARYMLDVNIVTSPVDLPANPNKFVRIELSANFTDTGVVVLPYNFSGREGHTTESEAENRVYAAAERKINEEYKGMLSDYLAQLLPKR